MLSLRFTKKIGNNVLALVAVFRVVLFDHSSFGDIDVQPTLWRRWGW